MSSYNTIRDYFGNKEFKASEILQFSIMIVLGIFLIFGGIIILQDEEIFKKIYEGFQSPTSSSSTWTATLPEDLTLTSLQKNIKVLRKKSDINIGLAYTMIGIGSMLCLYQLYNLFLT